MYCIDSNRCPSSSLSYFLPVAKRGIFRSSLSLDGESMAVIDGEGTVHKFSLIGGPNLVGKTSVGIKLPAPLIPARASWISWTQTGDLILMDKKGNIKILET